VFGGGSSSRCEQAGLPSRHCEEGLSLWWGARRSNLQTTNSGEYISWSPFAVWRLLLPGSPQGSSGPRNDGDKELGDCVRRLLRRAHAQGPWAPRNDGDEDPYGYWTSDLPGNC